jgi:hypothetical protein
VFGRQDHTPWCSFKATSALRKLRHVVVAFHGLEPGYPATVFFSWWTTVGLSPERHKAFFSGVDLAGIMRSSLPEGASLMR